MNKGNFSYYDFIYILQEIRLSEMTDLILYH